MAEDPRARFSGAVQQLRIKTNTIELGLRWNGALRRLQNRGKKIGGVHEVVVEAGLNTAWPPHDQRHVGAGIGGAAFAANHGAARGLRSNLPVGTVVAVKNDERFFAEAEGINLLHHAADAFVHVLDHIRKISGVLILERRAVVPIFAIRRGHKRPMR